MNWKEIYNPITQDTHNSTLTIDDNHYISYLFPNNASVAETLGLEVASDKPEEGETALCTLSPWKCPILNGDFRKEYEAVVDQGYDACYKVFESLKAEHGSTWSDDE